MAATEDAGGDVCLETVVGAFPQFSPRQIELALNFHDGDLVKTAEYLRHEVDAAHLRLDEPPEFSIQRVALPLPAEQREMPKFVKLRKYRFMILSHFNPPAIRPFRSVLTPSAVHFADADCADMAFEPFEPPATSQDTLVCAVPHVVHAAVSALEHSDVSDESFARPPTTPSPVGTTSPCLDLSQDNSPNGPQDTDQDDYDALSPPVSDPPQRAYREGSFRSLDMCLIDEYSKPSDTRDIYLNSPLNFSPQCESEVEMVSVVEDSAVSVMFKVPKCLLFENSWVGIYDRYETNNDAWLQRASTSGKKNSVLRFAGLKRGRYSARFFINHTKGALLHVGGSDFVVGPIVLMTTQLLVQPGRRTLRATVDNTATPFWVGVFPQFPIAPNHSYLLCTPSGTTNPVDIDVTSLPPGSYECRYFSRESAEGFFGRAYHCSGSQVFTV